MSAVLALDALSCGYGQATVVRAVSLAIARGEALALLGKNGMGKTTLLRGIVGLLPRQGGQVALAGQALPEGQPHRVAARGIAYAPQEQAVFQDLTIEQNLRVAVPDRQRLRDGHRAHRHLLPLHRPAAGAEGGHALRRRAEDADPRPRADGPAEACCCSTRSPKACSRR